MQKIIPEDLYKFQFLSGLHYAPDGQSAALLVRQADADKNNYACDLWLYRKGCPPQPLTSSRTVSAYCWESADSLLFFDKRTDDEKARAAAGQCFTPVYRISRNGGEAQKVAELPFAAQELAVVDKDWLVVLGQIDVADPDLYLKSDAERLAAVEKAKAEKDFQVLDELPFRFNGLGYTNKRRTAVFLVHRTHGSVLRLSAPEAETAAYTVNDGKIYYAAEPFTGKRLYRQKLYCYDPAAQQSTCLYDGAAYEISYLTVFRGGLVFAGCTQERYGYNENPMFYRVDLTTRQITLFSDNPDSLHPAIGSDMRLGHTSLVQSCPDGIYYLATHRNAVCLMRMDAEGKRHIVLGNEGTVDDFSVNPSTGEILTAALYHNRPQELYLFSADGTAEQCVSSFQAAALADKYVAPLEYLPFTYGGYDLDGWVLKPINYDPTKKYPAVLDIHGGPKMAYGPVFYHEMQVWASLGYFVFYCNPIGSDGRGNDFVDMRGKYGTVDYDSLMAFVDAVLAKYPQIDQGRVGVTGGSYGGYMTNWIITHTDRFCCAASQRSISNWLSFYGYSDLGYNFNVDQLAANPFTDPKEMWDRSPMKYAAKAHTPTLFLHSDEDYRCPLGEGLQLYTALVDLGVPARMCIFHGENHELSRSGRPASRLRRLQEIDRWLALYCEK